MQTVLRTAERALRNLIDQRRGRSPLALVDCGYEFFEANQAWEFWVHLAGEPNRNYWRISARDLQLEHNALHAGARIDIPFMYNTLAEAEISRQRMFDVAMYRRMETRIVWNDLDIVDLETPVRASSDIADTINQVVEGQFRQAMFGMDMAATTNAAPEAPATALTVETIREAMEQVRALDRRTSIAAEGGYQPISAELMRDALIFGRRGFVSFLAGYPEAERKGLTLLKNWLSPKQLKQFEKHDYFDVKGGTTGTWYRIKRGNVQNVYELGRVGNIKHGLCFAPHGNLVEGDVMLAQKIALETDERAALAVANQFLVR